MEDSPGISGPSLPSEDFRKGKPKTFNCPACGGTITVKATGHSVTAICDYCSSIIDVANENFSIIESVRRKTRQTIIPIGARGVFHDVEWEAIGYMEKTDRSGHYPWEEYLLYNPCHGFRFLMQADGHWNFMQVLKRDIDGAGITDQVWIGDRRYQIFLRGEAVVKYVKGEFYWRVKAGDHAKVTDYIAPPYIFSTETVDGEITLAWGKYIEPAEVAAAFSIDTEIPQKNGVAPNQPSRYQEKFLKIWLTAAVAILFSFVLQLITIGTSDNEQVYAMETGIQPADKDKTLSSDSFVLPKQENLLIQSTSPVANDWVELELSLVNEQDNTSYNLTQAIEYYYGYDSDGSWREGSQSRNTFLSAIPAGQYRMLIDVDAGAFRKGEPVTVSMAIRRDVPSWINFIVISLLILVYPLWVTWRRSSFESSRWENSDYTSSGHYKEDY